MQGRQGLPSRADHPRTRGEKSGVPDEQTADEGSPPHTRGKAVKTSSSLSAIRITPAHAGKSYHAGFEIEVHADHPRTRGEKSLAALLLGLVQGSPPHTRGKGYSNCYILKVRGITPAHAGKSRTEKRRRRYNEDHPRTRGEKSRKGEASVVSWGSPPHTRGKVRFVPVRLPVPGITPAHAGKSALWRRGSRRRGDHPRTRGEKSTGQEAQTSPRGSPPHTRGKARPCR